MKTNQNKIQLLQVGLKCLILNKNGEILLLKKVPREKENHGSYYDIPGGRIDIEQGLQANLLREIKEETGFSKIKDLVLVAVQDIFNKERHIVRLTYISRVTRSENVILSEEHADYQWVDLNKLASTKGLDRYLVDIIKDKNTMSFIKTYINKG